MWLMWSVCCGECSKDEDVVSLEVLRQHLYMSLSCVTCTTEEKLFEWVRFFALSPVRRQQIERKVLLHLPVPVTARRVS